MLRKPHHKEKYFSTTARQLFKAYDENEVATDEKMKGKLISVKGVVQSIDKDFTDSIIISFRTDNEFNASTYGNGRFEKSAAIALKKGQQVTVICERMSRIVGAPSGRDCVFTH
ncbi:tRNA_anti-like [Salmonella enterica]|nr:tRNA_anti-like [Salmonella enterica]